MINQPPARMHALLAGAGSAFAGSAFAKLAILADPALPPLRFPSIR